MTEKYLFEHMAWAGRHPEIKPPTKHSVSPSLRFHEDNYWFIPFLLVSYWLTKVEQPGKCLSVCHWPIRGYKLNAWKPPLAVMVDMHPCIVLKLVAIVVVGYGKEMTQSPIRIGKYKLRPLSVLIVWFHNSFIYKTVMQSNTHTHTHTHYSY